MKLRPVATKLFLAGEETDRTKLIVAFRICAKAPEKATNCKRHLKVVIAEVWKMSKT